MKRILHLLSSSIYSGAENVVATIISSFSLSSSKDNFCFAYCSPKGTIEQILFEKNICFYGIKRMSAVQIKRVIKTFKPDIIHAHDFKASCIASLFSRRATIISHIHNNARWLKNKGLKSRFYLFCSRRFYRIIGVSDSIINEYAFGNKIKEKYITLFNPFDSSTIIKQSLSAELNSINPFDLCFCGRLSPEKDPILFLRIVSEVKKTIPNITCKIIGDGVLSDEVKKYIILNNLSNNVELTGFTKNPYVYIAKSKMVIITSNVEGFGLVALESLCLGKPILCTKVGGLKSIVNDKCGFFCNSVRDFADRCLQLINNNSLYDGFSKYAIEHAKSFDNIGDYIERLKEIYDI